jgi:hypothetical protein
MQYVYTLQYIKQCVIQLAFGCNNLSAEMQVVDNIKLHVTTFIYCRDYVNMVTHTYQSRITILNYNSNIGYIFFVI